MDTKTKVNKYVDKIMLYSQWFDMFKIAKDTDNMFVTLYQMRLHHGLMIAEVSKSIGNVTNDDITNQETNKRLYDISINDSIISSVRTLIAESEEIFKNYIVNKKLEDMTSKYPSSAKLDVEKGVYPGKEWLKKFHEEKGKIDIKDVFCCDAYDIKYPSIILFYTNWCKYSKLMLPVWNKFRDSCKRKKLNLIKVNCEDKGEFCKKFGILGYPTVMLFHNGTKKEYMGNRSIEGLQKFISDETDVRY